MGPRDELMERLVAADPLCDAERLAPDEQREADALLARLLATPPEERSSRSRAPLRRWTLVAAGAACSVLVGFAAFNVLDSRDAPVPNIVARAVAAMSAHDAVYHVLDHRRAKNSRFPGQNAAVYFESWHTSDGGLHQKMFADRHRRQGRLLNDFAGRKAPGRRGGPALSWDARNDTISSMRFGTSPGGGGAPSLDPYADPGATLRALEDEGRLRLAGSVEVDGRHAYRLVSGPVRRPHGEMEERVEFIVDAETYLPLASRFVTRSGAGDRLELVTRYLVYERLPLNARSRAKLDLDPHPGAECAPGAGKTIGRGTLGFPNPCAR